MAWPSGGRCGTCRQLSALSGTCPCEGGPTWPLTTAAEMVAGRRTKHTTFKIPKKRDKGCEDVDGYDEDEEDFLGDEANDDVQEHFNHVENANLDDKRRRAEVLCMSSNAGDVAVKTKRVRFDVSLGAV
ncbi:hypothetical protein E4U27_000519 [Claviceps purpurea]|nr:hypothetical protein E4U27_000519 [Claviceps purpurea]